MLRDEIKVRRLKDAVASGTYTLDAALIADGLLKYFASTVFLSEDDIPEALGEV